MKIIFLDIDGVVKNYDGWQKENLARVKRLCEEVGAEIVLTSDLRRPSAGKDHWDMRKALGDAGLTPFFNSEWQTKHFGWDEDTRWKEVGDWLIRNQDDFDGYMILEDTFSHFDSAHPEIKERIVWCNNRHGFVEELYQRAKELIQLPI